MSGVGFEPTPTFVDQNTHPLNKEGINLESGALDHSANLTYLLCNEIKYIFIVRFQSVSHITGKTDACYKNKIYIGKI